MVRALYYTLETYKKSMLIGFRDMQENLFSCTDLFLHPSMFSCTSQMYDVIMNDVTPRS